MKAPLATLALAAQFASAAWFTPGHAIEAEQTDDEDSAEPESKLPRGALTCALQDPGNALTHVLLCRFEASEDCVLTAPMAFKDMMQRFEAVKILKIGSTPEGCSELTFSGTLKNPE